MLDLGVDAWDSCRAVCIAVVESERTQTFRSVGAWVIAKVSPFLSPSATEARFPRKAPD